MTEEAKRAVEHLRGNAEFQWCSDCYVGDGCGDAYHSNCHFLRIADLIESLSAELEQVERERDAAVKHLLECHKTICPTCIHRTGAGCDKNANAGVDEAVIFCVDYEWCGFVR